MASTPGVSTTDLLRRALVVARRLSAPELVEWLNSELTGYSTDAVPDYREMHAQLKVRNPRHGWQPFHVPPDIAELVTRFTAIQSIPQLQHLLISEGNIICPFAPEAEQLLMQMMQEVAGVMMQPALIISSVQIEGIIETVRTRVLDWALDLESRGVVGEGLTFTPAEKQVVQAQHYHFGNVSGSQIQVNSAGSSQIQTNNEASNDVKALNGLIVALGDALDRSVMTGDAVEELRADLATLKAQAASPKPKWEIIRATARSIRTIAEGTAGNILGEIAKSHVQTLLALAGSTIGGLAR